MSKKPESRLQTKIQKALKEAFPRSWWRKIHGGQYQRKGIPDLLGCVPDSNGIGRFFGLEVKCPDGDPPTDLQKTVLKQIKRAGGGSCVVTSPEEAIDAVRRTL